MTNAHEAGPILVTGGTGTLGRLLVPRLVAAGRDVRVLSRRAAGDGDPAGIQRVAGDLATGEGVAAAVAGAEVVVHCAGSSRGDEEKAAQIVQAASAAGVRHLVYISVVGADRIPVVSAADRAMYGYFASKRAAELIVAESGIPWTTLRATQFHELLLTVAQMMGRLPLVPLPSGLRFQPVAADEVAARMAELALGAPAGLVPDVAGPEIHTGRELLRSWLRAHGKHRPIVPFRQPGGAARAFRGGANLAPERAVGRKTWAEALGERTR